MTDYLNQVYQYFINNTYPPFVLILLIIAIVIMILSCTLYLAWPTNPSKISVISCSDDEYKYEYEYIQDKKVEYQKQLPKFKKMRKHLIITFVLCFVIPFLVLAGTQAYNGPAKYTSSTAVKKIKANVIQSEQNLALQDFNNNKLKYNYGRYLAVNNHDLSKVQKDYLFKQISNKNIISKRINAEYKKITFIKNYYSIKTSNYETSALSSNKLIFKNNNFINVGNKYTINLSNNDGYQQYYDAKLQHQIAQEIKNK